MLRPVLVDLWPEVALPGRLSSFDAAAWWLAMSGDTVGPMPITEASTADPVLSYPQGAPRTPSGEEREEILRQTVLKILHQALQEPRRRERLLGLVNCLRIELAPNAELHALGDEDLDTLVALLDAIPTWRTLSSWAAPMDSSEMLLLLRSTHEAVSQRDLVLLGLAHLHARPSPKFAVALYEFYPAPLVEKAMLAHFALAATHLQAAVRRLARHASGFTPGSAVSDPLKLQEQFWEWFDELSAGGFDAAPEKPSLSVTVEAIAVDIAELLKPTLVKRLKAASLPTLSTSLMNAVLFVQLFDREAGRRQFGCAQRQWPPDIGHHLNHLFREAVGLSEAGDMEKPGEIAAFARRIGQPIEVSVLHEGLLTAAAQALRSRRAFSEPELGLLMSVVELCLEEHRKTRSWPSASVRRVIEAARSNKTFLGAARHGR
jgi:hypothetical protein